MTWLVPLALTVSGFAWAMAHTRNFGFSPHEAARGLLVYAVAVIASLVAWLVWALLT